LDTEGEGRTENLIASVESAGNKRIEGMYVFCISLILLSIRV